MPKPKNLVTIANSLPVDCRDHAANALKVLEKSRYSRDIDLKCAVNGLICGVRRTSQRRESDQRTDFKRRKLVGVRVPFLDYLRYLAAAESEGISLYRWVVNALSSAAATGRGWSPPR